MTTFGSVGLVKNSKGVLLHLLQHFVSAIDREIMRPEKVHRGGFMRTSKAFRRAKNVFSKSWGVRGVGGRLT